MRMIIIGCGTGGLQAAYALAKGGCDVTVYEKKAREALAYDWRDNVEPGVFAQLEIPFPETTYLCECVSMYGPNAEKPLFIAADRAALDRNLDRRELAELLVTRAASAGAAIRFETPVDALITEDGKVRGVIVGGKAEKADLVIDASGIFSPFRASLPGLAEPAKDEYFVAWRAYYKMKDGAEAPEKNRRRVYLRHMGQNGLSWCVAEPDGTLDVLVGRTGELPDAVLADALARLRADNPYLSDAVVRAGQKAVIPIRQPAAILVREGYALVGDSAFMTIPLRGSGIAQSLRAGQMLADAVLAAGNAYLHTLWKYQVRFYREIGAKQFVTDAIKRFVLTADADKLRDAFTCGLITDGDLRGIMTGEGFSLSARSALEKLRIALPRTPFLAKMGKAALAGVRLSRLAKAIPDRYDPAKVRAWTDEMTRLTTDRP